MHDREQQLDKLFLSLVNYNSESIKVSREYRSLIISFKEISGKTISVTWTAHQADDDVPSFYYELRENYTILEREIIYTNSPKELINRLVEVMVKQNHKKLEEIQERITKENKILYNISRELEKEKESIFVSDIESFQAFLFANNDEKTLFEALHQGREYFHNYDILSTILDKINKTVDANKYQEVLNILLKDTKGLNRDAVTNFIQKNSRDLTLTNRIVDVVGEKFSDFTWKNISINLYPMFKKQVTSLVGCSTDEIRKLSSIKNIENFHIFSLVNIGKNRKIKIKNFIGKNFTDESIQLYVDLLKEKKAIV